MNGPLFLANVNDLYICPFGHPGLIFLIPACETQVFFFFFVSFEVLFVFLFAATGQMLAAH